MNYADPPIMQSDPSNIFGGAAIFGVIIGFWSYVKMYLFKFYSLFVIKIILTDQVSIAMTTYLQAEFKCSPIGGKNYTGYNDYIRPLNRNQLVAFENIPSEPTIWWKNKKPLIVSGDQYKIILTFIRGTYNRDELIQNAVDYFNKDKNNKNWKESDRFFISKKHGSIGSNKNYHGEEAGVRDVPSSQPDKSSTDSTKYTSRPVKWKRSEIGQPKNEGAINKLSLSKEAEDLLAETVLWRDSETWFKNRCIPWKRGLLLYGSPGTGKTAFARSLGQELNMPIFSFDLATMTNKDFSNTWSEMMSWTPCIALFEDIDSIFKDRDNISVKGMENGLTFDGFLNCIDGVENTDGIFIIITTNNIDTIDPAIGNPVNGSGMSTRPGRIDKAIEFGILNEEGRIKMAKRIMNGFDDSKWKHLLKEGKNDTGAQFQERCCRLALSMFWKEKKLEDEKYINE